MSPVTQPSQAHTDSEEVLVGGDTHKDVHLAAVISVLGVVLGPASFPTTAAGDRQLLAGGGGFGTLRRAGVECTGSCGAALSRSLLAAGLAVFEVNQPDKASPRRRGKTDAIDAEAAARAVLSGQATALAKTSKGPVERVRMFRGARASAITSHTQAIHQLKAVLVCADPLLRESLSGLSTTTRMRPCAPLPTQTPSDITTAAVYTWPLLARRILDLTQQSNDLKQRITQVLSAPTPQLLDHDGVEPRHRVRITPRRWRQPRTTAQRGPLRRPARCQSHQGVPGQGPAPSTPSGRGSTSTLRLILHRFVPAALRRPQPQLRSTTHRRRQDPPRSNPLPQALRRPQGLPAPQPQTRTHYATGLSDLTSIRASTRTADTSAPPPRSPPVGTGTPRNRTSTRAVGRDDDASGHLARAADPPTQQCLGVGSGPVDAHGRCFRRSGASSTLCPSGVRMNRHRVTEGRPAWSQRW